MTHAVAVIPFGFTDDEAYYVLDPGRRPVPATQAEFEAMPFETRHVARDEVGGLTLTTHFIGFDISLLPGELPAVFVTSVTADGDGWSFDAYASWVEAEAGHARAIAHYAGMVR